MEIYIAVAAIILVVILFTATSKSQVEKIDKTEMDERNKNEFKFFQVINAEPSEQARDFLKKAKELFDSGECLEFLDVYVKIGVPEHIAYSKDADLIKEHLGFESEQAEHLFGTYCLAISARYDLQNSKLRVIDDAFDKHKLILKKGEVLYSVFYNMYCFQEKTIMRNITYTGLRYRSGLLRAGNLSYATNDIKSFVVEDYGTVFLTNKRIVFVGKQKNFSLTIAISSIRDYYLYKDSVLLHMDNKKNVTFKEAQYNNHTQPDDDYCFILNDFPIQFISIIGRIANQTENLSISEL